jgi:hypothetical protein
MTAIFQHFPATAKLRATGVYTPQQVELLWKINRLAQSNEATHRLLQGAGLQTPKFFEKITCNRRGFLYLLSHYAGRDLVLVNETHTADTWVLSAPEFDDDTLIIHDRRGVIASTVRIGTEMSLRGPAKLAEV